MDTPAKLMRTDGKAKASRFCWSMTSYSPRTAGSRASRRKLFSGAITIRIGNPHPRQPVSRPYEMEKTMIGLLPDGFHLGGGRAFNIVGPLLSWWSPATKPAVQKYYHTDFGHFNAHPWARTAPRAFMRHFPWCRARLSAFSERWWARCWAFLGASQLIARSSAGLEVVLGPSVSSVPTCISSVYLPSQLLWERRP